MFEREELIKKYLSSFLCLMILFLIGRIYFFIYFMPDDLLIRTPIDHIAHVFFSSTRFDLSVTSGLFFIPVIGTIVFLQFSKKSGKIFGRICLLYIQICLYVSAFLILLSHYYFYYYGDHFNIFFWEFWENWENSKLVLISILHEIPIISTFLSVFLIIIFINFLPKIILPIVNSIFLLFPIKTRFVLISFLLLFGIRGTLDPLPLTMQRYRGQISSERHLNLIHGNPYYELYASWENHINYSDTSNIKLFLKESKKEIPNWLNKVAETDNRRMIKGSKSLSFNIEYSVSALRDRYLKKKPKHIVLIFMESHSSWLFLFEGENYEQNIIKNLKRIKEKSLSFSRYFAAGNNSTSNLIKINFPVPTTKNFQIAFSSEIFKSFDNTLPRILEDYGYSSKFFFGGSMNYHQLDQIIPKLGFHEFFGESSFNTVSKSRFGAHDEDLLEFVHKKLLSAKKPTFNFVVTTSNHPPYDVPNNFKGLVNASNAPISIKKRIIDKDNFNKRMRALAYADKAIGDFFKKAQKSSYFKETLFVLTADHPHSMGLKWSQEEYYIRNKIPLFFYSPNLLKVSNVVSENFGSHMDIAATILSIISEKSKKINSWGRNLLEKPKIDLLTSHYFDCLNDICNTNEPTFNNSVYILKNNEKLVQCMDETCKKKSQHLKGITESFWYSGLNYIFNK